MKNLNYKKAIVLMNVNVIKLLLSFWGRKPRDNKNRECISQQLTLNSWWRFCWKCWRTNSQSCTLIEQGDTICGGYSQLVMLLLFTNHTWNLPEKLHNPEGENFEIWWRVKSRDFITTVSRIIKLKNNNKTEEKLVVDRRIGGGFPK